MEKKGLFTKIKSFFREVRQETRKVSWPARKEATKYTLIVISVSIALAILLGGFDYILLTLLRNFVI